MLAEAVTDGTLELQFDVSDYPALSYSVGCMHIDFGVTFLI